MKVFQPCSASALTIAVLATWPVTAHAAAGVAQFTAGEVNVRQPDGRTLSLAKGGDIDSGQAIVTGASGRAQVRFTDGGLVSLQPNTEFKIANYVDQNDPKEDRFLVDLLRGSMRAITGLIGKRNRDNYKLTTTTATIGIRGSGFKVGYNPDGSVGITSELDKIEVCNQSGCMGLVAGESVKVLDNTTPPVRTSVQPKVETPSTEKDPLVVGDKVDERGKSSLIPPEVSKGTTYMDLRVLAAATDSSNNPVNELPTGNGLTTTLDGNRLVEILQPGAASTSWVPASGATVISGAIGNPADADFVGWGSWSQSTKQVVSGTTTTSTLQYFHYVLGRPTPIPQMPISGYANYGFAGGSSPTRINGGGTTLGTITAATTNLSVDFTNSSLTANIDTSLVSFSDTATISGASFLGAYVNGFFTGVAAGGAALTFKKALTAGDNVTGAIVFTKLPPAL